MSRKKKKSPSSSQAYVLLVVLALITLGGVLAYIYGGRYWYDHRKGNFTERVELFVYPDSDGADIRDQILSRAKDRRSLERSFRLEHLDEAGISPGHYVIRPEYTSVYVARMLSHGWQEESSLTLSGSIRTREALASRLAAPLMLDREEIFHALADNHFLKAHGVDSVSVFSLFIPDTYRIRWTASVEEVFARFQKEYEMYWNEERRSLAAALGLTPYEVSILASIVDGETKHEPEMARIAGVYLNRLHRGMLLQADPTVAFCFDYKIQRVLSSHLAVDSPYNTYQHTGLPPGPISVPPKACIEAVLHAEKHAYLYFCASPELNGSHRFASNLSVHNANAAAYHAALTAWQKKKKQQ